MSRPQWYRHYLTNNHSEARPTDYVFVDVETNSEELPGTTRRTKLSLRLGVACYVRWERNKEPREKWFNFEFAEHFWNWLDSLQRKKRVVWVVAHNACFDLTILGLWQHIETGRYAITRPGYSYKQSRTGETVLSKDWHGLLAIDGTPFHVETHGITGRINFTDLQNYYPLPLKTIGSMVGLEKGQWDEVRQSETDLRFYCHNDVEILKRAYLGLVEKWESQHNGNWKFSAAGLAHSCFRHKYLDKHIAIHSHAEAQRIEWQSLFGGEVRCWFRGKAPGNVVHYDVNSLYPSVMVDRVYPTALVDYILRPSRAIFRSLTAKYAAIAEVDLHTNKSVYPYRTDKRTIYPVGRFTTTLAGPELLAALERGHITHCYSLAIYTHAPIFNRYVLEWWDEKQRARARGDKATEAFSKLMLNSLPAKFAQRSPVWVNDPRVSVVEPFKVFPFRDPDTKTIHSARSVGWIGQVMKERVATEHSFPAIYAYVTSYAREKMRHVRSILQNGVVYYQDTDSVIVDETGSHELRNFDGMVGDGIGQLREVGCYKDAIFRGIKNYSLDGRHIIAGVRARDNEIQEMSWSGERFERVSAIFNRQPDGTIRTHAVDFDTPGANYEGNVNADGWCDPPEVSKMLGKQLGAY